MRDYSTEMKTIAGRTVTIRLSDSDCLRLLDRCGSSGITVSQLVENYIGDLIDGTYSNGSDERRSANEWFNRCWFGMFPEKTLLSYLLEWGYDPEEFFELFTQVDAVIKEKEYLSKHPEEQEPDDIEFLTRMISDCCKVINSMTEGWKPEGDPNLSVELRRVVSWIDEKNRLIGKTDSLIFGGELKEIDLEKVLSELEMITENDMEECCTLPAE